MDTVLEKLSEIEAAASMIMESADNQIRFYSEQLEENIKKYDRQVDKTNQEKLEELKTRLSEEARKKMEKMEADTRAHLSHMEQAFAEKQDQLADAIFDQLIGKTV